MPRSLQLFCEECSRQNQKLVDLPACRSKATTDLVYTFLFDDVQPTKCALIMFFGLFIRSPFLYAWGEGRLRKLQLALTAIAEPVRSHAILHAPQQSCKPRTMKREGRGMVGGACIRSLSLSLEGRLGKSVRKNCKKPLVSYWLSPCELKEENGKDP